MKTIGIVELVDSHTKNAATLVKVETDGECISIDSRSIPELALSTRLVLTYEEAGALLNLLRHALKSDGR